MKKTARNDIVLIVVVLCLSLVVFYAIKLNSKEGDTVQVFVNGQCLSEYSLFTDGVYVLNEGTNTLEIKNGMARIIDANCRDSLCEKKGFIHLNGESITCLPNKLTIVIKADAEEVDFVL